MKISLSFILMTLSLILNAQIDFDTYFNDKSMRFDYIIGGNNHESNIYLNKLKEETYWGGSKINLIDTFNFGDFRVLIYDAKTDKLIYSRGYSTLYYEWLDTDEAKKISRSFYESVLFPFPKNEIVLKIEMRLKNTVFKTIYEQKINPNDSSVIKDKQIKYKTQRIHYSGDHHKKLDIVIIPDGYTKNEIEKFHSDCKRFVNYFFEVEPFKSNKDLVNFWAIDAESEETGTDIPGENIWKNTIIDSHFYTFNSERYLTTQNIEQLRNLAAYVPYDQIYILVNTPKYGGGGIFNYYNLCSSDHEQSGLVFTHEFGHAFAALADEYQYGYDKADDIYDMSVEPWQPNISNLVNFDLKWKYLVDKTTPIPTPDERKYKDKIGAFEGAGYVTKGIYRPADDCKMRSNSTDEFCPVCYSVVLKMLKFYTE